MAKKLEHEHDHIGYTNARQQPWRLGFRSIWRQSMTSELYQATCQTSLQIIKSGTFATWQGQSLQQTYQLSTYLCGYFVEPKLFLLPKSLHAKVSLGGFCDAWNLDPNSSCTNGFFVFNVMLIIETPDILVGLFEQNPPAVNITCTQAFSQLTNGEKWKLLQQTFLKLIPGDDFSHICQANSNFPAIWG